MLQRNGIKMRKLVTLSKKNITGKDVLSKNTVFNPKGRYDPIVNPKEFNQEFGNTHWLSYYTDKLWLWYKAPFRLRIWNTDKDTELGRFAWNVNAYNNSLAKLLFRNEKLQSKKLMNFLVKRFDHRFALEVNKAEEPPKISSNSVFLYKDSSYKMVNRRSVERFGLFMLLTMAWNPSTLLLYTFLGLYFQVLNKNYYTSKCLVFRMDLIPETEQLHVVKVAALGMPTSVIVNVKDLVKIEKEEDLTHPLKWYKTRVWIPFEDEFMIFKDISTGEILTFHKKGIWNEDGLSHPLLN